MDIKTIFFLRGRRDHGIFQKVREFRFNNIPFLSGQPGLPMTLSARCNMFDDMLSSPIRRSIHSELPRPIFQIRPRMYVRRTIIYEIAAFCSPEEHA